MVRLLRSQLSSGSVSDDSSASLSALPTCFTSMSALAIVIVKRRAVQAVRHARLKWSDADIIDPLVLWFDALY
jgi:hypothetical protein